MKYTVGNIGYYEGYEHKEIHFTSLTQMYEILKHFRNNEHSGQITVSMAFTNDPRR